MFVEFALSFSHIHSRSDIYGLKDTIDIYDMNTGQWSSTSTGVGSLSLARTLLAAAGLGNKILFAGGRYDR